MIKKTAIVLFVLTLCLIGINYYRVKTYQRESGVQEQTAQQQTVFEIDGTDLVISSSGTVQKKTEGKSLPKIFLPAQITPTENANIEDPKVKFALSLIQSLSKTDFTPTQVRFVDEVDVIVHSQTEATALFTINKDVIFQVDSLQSVLSKAKIDAAKITKIDLRFDKPVITYK